MLFGRWVMLSLYTIYSIVVWQISDVILISHLQHYCLADEWCYPYTLLTHSIIHIISYEGMVFRKAVHLIHCYLFVELGSSHYSFTHSHAYAVFQNSPRCTNQLHICSRNTGCSLFCSSLHTHSNDVVSLWAPMLGMFHFQATYLGYRWTRSPSRYATCSHRSGS